MNRKEMINFICKKIYPQIDYHMETSPREIIGLIEKWHIGKPVDIEMNPVVNDGFLFINGDPVGCIASKLPKMPYSRSAAYWEGCILARQENDFD